MNTQGQSRPSVNASPDEDYNERGLRTLGILIARDLAKRHRVNEDKACNHKIGDSPISGIKYEDVS